MTADLKWKKTTKGWISSNRKFKIVPRHDSFGARYVLHDGRTKIDHTFSKISAAKQYAQKILAN